MGASNVEDMKKSRFLTNISLNLGMIEYMAMERQYELVCDLSNGAIFNNLEQPLDQMSWNTII